MYALSKSLVYGWRKNKYFACICKAVMLCIIIQKYVQNFTLHSRLHKAVKTEITKVKYDQKQYFYNSHPVKLFLKQRIKYVQQKAMRIYVSR